MTDHSVVPVKMSNDISNLETSREALNFNSNWILYWHPRDSTEWSINSYQEKYRIQSVPKFWALYNNLRSVAYDMFFLMREGHPPLWEDPKNIHGGALSYRINNKDVDNFWLIASMLLVGETICNHPAELIGLSVSPKLRNTTIRLWYRDINQVQPIIDSLHPELNRISNDFIIRHHQEPEKIIENHSSEDRPHLELVESSVIVHYSLTALHALNSDKYRNIPGQLANFLAKIQSNKFLTSYLNPYNRYLCPPTQRKVLFPKAEAFSDEKIVEDLQTLLSKVTDQNVNQIKTKLRKIPFTQSCWGLILPMIHQVTIDCVFLIDSLLEILLELQEIQPDFLARYQNLLEMQFKNPQVFVATELSLETAEDKHKRWIISNSQIMCALYKKGIYDNQWLSDFLDTIFENISPENPIGIEILNQNWDSIRRQIPPEISEAAISRMDDLSHDPEYPNRLRFLLMDLIDMG